MAPMHQVFATQELDEVWMLRAELPREFHESQDSLVGEQFLQNQSCASPKFRTGFELNS